MGWEISMKEDAGHNNPDCPCFINTPICNSIECPQWDSEMARNCDVQVLV